MSADEINMALKGEPGLCLLQSSDGGPDSTSSLFGTTRGKSISHPELIKHYVW